MRKLATATQKKIVELFDEYKKAQPVADELGISLRTTLKYLKIHGAPLKRGVPKGSTFVSKHRSCLAEWIREHPDVSLPRKVSEISRITGCSENQIKTYLYRRRQAVKKLALSIDWKNLTDLIHGRDKKFNPRSISNYDIKVDRYSFDVSLMIRTKFNTHHTITIPLEEVERIGNRDSGQRSEDGSDSSDVESNRDSGAVGQPSGSEG